MKERRKKKTQQQTPNDVFIFIFLKKRNDYCILKNKKTRFDAVKERVHDGYSKCKTQCLLETIFFISVHDNN